MQEATGIPVSTFSAKEKKGGFDEEEIKGIIKILKISREELEKTQVDQKGNADDQVYLVNGMIRIEASLRILLRGLAEVEATVTKQPATKVLSEYTTAVRKEISIVRDELTSEG